MTDANTEPAVEAPRRDHRGIALAIVLAILLVAAIAVDQVGGAPDDLRQRTEIAKRGPGVWGCPMVAPGRLGGTLSLANTGDASSRVVVRWVHPPLKPIDRALTLGPRHSLALAAPASASTFTSAIVEWGGGEVVASYGAPLITQSKRRVALGAACSRPGETVLAAAGLRTLRMDSAIVILNPSGADALVNVSFLVEGDEQAPESLRNRIVPARGRLVVHAGDFVFDRASLGAIIRVVTGAVVAHAEVSGGVSAAMVPFTGLRREAAVTAHFLKDARIEVIAVGEDASSMESTTITAARRQTTVGFPPALDPNKPSTVRMAGTGPQAATLVSREGSPFVANLTWGIPSAAGSDATFLPFGGSAMRYIAAIGPPATGPGMRLVLANPGAGDIVVNVRLITPDGPAPFSAGELITLGAGRARSFLIGLKAQVFGLELTAGGPMLASLAGSGGSGTTAFLYSVAPEPADPLTAPVLLVDPRTGANAP